MTAPYILARNAVEASAFAQNELGLARGHYRIVTSPASIKVPRAHVDLYLVPGWTRRVDRFAMAGALRWSRMNQIDVEEWRAENDETPGLPQPPEGWVPFMSESTTSAQAYVFSDERDDEGNPLWERLATEEDAERAAGVALALADKDAATVRSDEPLGQVVEDPPTIKVKVVSDDVEPPKSHTDLVSRVMPAEEVHAQIDKAIDELTAEVDAPKRRRRRCKDCGVLVEPDEVEAHAETHEQGE